MFKSINFIKRIKERKLERTRRKERTKRSMNRYIKIDKGVMKSWVERW